LGNLFSGGKAGFFVSSGGGDFGARITNTPN